MKFTIGSLSRGTKLIAVAIPFLVVWAVSIGTIDRSDASRLSVKQEQFSLSKRNLLPTIQRAFDERRFDEVIRLSEPYLEFSEELRGLAAAAVAGKLRTEHQKRLYQAKDEVTKLQKAGDLKAAWEIARPFEESEFTYLREKVRDQYAIIREPELLQQLRTIPEENVLSRLAILQDLAELRPTNEKYRLELAESKQIEAAMSGPLLAVSEAKLQEAQEEVRNFEKRILSLDAQVKPLRIASTSVWRALARKKVDGSAAEKLLTHAGSIFRAAMNEASEVPVPTDRLPPDVLAELQAAVSALTDSYNCFSLALDKALQLLKPEEDERKSQEYTRWVELSQAATQRSAAALATAKQKVGLLSKRK